MTALRLVLAGILTALGLVLVTPVASQACDCAPGSTVDQVERADVVFVGSVMETDPAPRRAAGYRFSVGRVLEGEVAPFVVVESAFSGAACGLEDIEVGKEYVVFATHLDGALVSGLCTGTRPAVPADVEEVARADRPRLPDLSVLVATVLGFFA